MDNENIDILGATIAEAILIGPLMAALVGKGVLTRGDWGKIMDIGLLNLERAEGSAGLEYKKPLQFARTYIEGLIDAGL